MTTLNSPPLSATCTVNPNAPRRVTFTFNQPFVSPLFLGIMTLTEAAIAGIIGHIVPGTGPTHGGNANLRVNTTLFGTIYATASANQPGVSVVIQYEDGTFTVDNIQCTPQPPKKAGQALSL